MPIQPVTPESLKHAAALLQQGQLVVFPTETVYGLGADARNTTAIQRLFRIKGRPDAHPVILHIADIEQLNTWACDIPPIAWTLCQAFWPGPLTVILRKAPDVSPLITGGQETIGIRMPSHPDALALLSACNGALVAPSANRFGQLSPTLAAHVAEQFNDQDVPLILDGGPCEVGIESTIVDLSNVDMSVSDVDPIDQLSLPFNSRILRPGMISREHLCAVMKEAQLLLNSLQPNVHQAYPRVSGALESHYAPTKPVMLVPALMMTEALTRYSHQSIAVLSFEPQPDTLPTLPNIAHWITATPNEADYARHLYAWLHALDHTEADVIWIEWSVQDMWPGVADRLQRAASGILSTDMQPSA